MEKNALSFLDPVDVAFVGFVKVLFFVGLEVARVLERAQTHTGV